MYIRVRRVKGDIYYNQYYFREVGVRKRLPFCFEPGLQPSLIVLLKKSDQSTFDGLIAFLQDEALREQ